MKFNDVLDEIFETYMSKKDLIKGMPYKDYKNTDIFKRLLIKTGLMEDLPDVIKVTGSKGKGTTTRTIAKIIENYGGRRVGAFTSPEETCHNDRISINGIIITETKFVEYYLKIRPIINEDKSNLSGLDYYSPYGIYLLIALYYFKDEGVDLIVLECGRGVRFDDSNHIYSKIGVITSIFEEHLSYFGPKIEDVFSDKIAISKTSEIVMAPKELSIFNSNQITYLVDSDISGVEYTGKPSVYNKSLILAVAVCSRYLGVDIKAEPSMLKTSSYGQLRTNGVDIKYDSIISVSGIDIGWVADNLNAHYFISIPDDKPVIEFLKAVRDMGLKFTLVAMKGVRGYLDYQQSKESGEELISLDINDFKDIAFFRDRCKSNDIVFWGTQTFIRYIKNCLPPELSPNPTSNPEP